MGDGVVERRTHFHDLPSLSVDGKLAAHAAIRANRFRVRLPRFVPRSRLAHVVFGFAHQRAGRADANAIPAIHARRIRQWNFKFRGNVRVEPAPGNANRERVLGVHAASFHAFVAEDALRVVAHVQFVVNFLRLRHRGGSRPEFLPPRCVAFHVLLQLRCRSYLHGRGEKFQHHAPAQPDSFRIGVNHHASFHFSRARRHQRARAF